MLHGTIDSVSMSHLCRPIVISRKSRPKQLLGLELISLALQDGKFSLYIDEGRSLIDEWMKTCSEDIVLSILTRWMDSGAMLASPVRGSIVPNGLFKQLLHLGFHDTGDKLIVRIGLGTVKHHNRTEFLIITNDGDFWDPFDGSKTGSVKAPVASVLRSHKILSTTLNDFFSNFG